ncbi:hypothetical protein GCM10011584_25190 [Nocardioides phosphati]|uniref:Uncharacterized protein n=1 Tax=Nocardioides phosphati TaxID=1867775 RepID=A0ABQ2NE63_9ACTN|nr:hypothetical protein GCM10011584_25190 [Nocardioides phosphati]
MTRGLVSPTYAPTTSFHVEGPSTVVTAGRGWSTPGVGWSTWVTDTSGERGGMRVESNGTTD